MFVPRYDNVVILRAWSERLPEAEIRLANFIYFACKPSHSKMLDERKYQVELNLLGNIDIQSTRSLSSISQLETTDC